MPVGLVDRPPQGAHAAIVAGQGDVVILDRGERGSGDDDDTTGAEEEGGGGGHGIANGTKSHTCTLAGVARGRAASSDATLAGGR